MTIEGQTLRRPGGLLLTTGKVWAVLCITLRSRLAYVGELLLRTLFLILILFTFTQLWHATNLGKNVLVATGFTIQELIWYLVFTEALMLSAANARELEVDSEVRSGDIAYRLGRPLPYPLFHLGAGLGERLLRFTLYLLVGMVVALVVVGPIQLSPMGVLMSCSIALVSFVGDWIWTFAISLTSFWIEDTFGLHLLYRRAFMILGGMLIPLSAYPEWLGRIARTLPFQYLVYYPARLFVHPDLPVWLAALGANLAIAVVGLLPLLLLYRIGLRFVSTQGG